ncbi:vesicular integral-membrane protein VIP36 [Bactrocera neohumeralis]|uniref:vesicular integral-membrane protein VIP36 n=1 Tax=Bactrocera tryoni TaxID=59916 RepID=UPI001A97A1D3|nr:vesicular integral-membrane protein VIP36 [Bactrocera tryoni]XP_050340516.1 vesicular integral-membrane protein VIP36 [Bactrocera neohumeralis]
MSNVFWENLNKLLPILLLSVLKNSECSVSSNEYMKREHSLIRPFQGVGVNLPYWDFLGHTMVTSNYIRLTPDLQSKSGALWNYSPVMTRNWELHVTFKVHGKGNELYGDGFSIWYTKERMQPGPVFGSKDYFSGLAVILDTYSNHNGPHNHQHPYLSAMINNGTWTYDHDRDGTHTQLAGCEVRFRNVDFDTHVSIRYENDILSVSTDMENKGEWKNCFVVNDVELPTGYFLGLSATTGDLSDSHDILGVKFYDLDINVSPEEIASRSSILPRAKTYEPPREHKDDPKPGMSNAKIFFILLFGMLITIAGAIFAISYFKEKNSRKRFY